MLDHPILSVKPHALLCASLTVLLASCGGGSGPVTTKSGQAMTDQYAATVVAASANLALNKPATASSVEASTFPASAAVDGTSGSRWSSLTSDAQWIRVDLGTASTINHVSLAWEAAYAKAYQVQVSADGVTWSTVYSTTNGTGGNEEIAFTAVSARYVRINCTQRGTVWGYSLFEFKVSNEATAVAPANIAQGKLALASSVEMDSLPAAAAFDGSQGSRWSSLYSDAQWLRVDLGAATTINHVVLDWEAAYAKSYEIQTSLDASNWNTVYSTTAGTGGRSDIRFNPVSARYVRMNGLQRATPWGYSLFEMSAYFDSVTTPTPAPTPSPAPTPPTGTNPLPTDAIFAPGSFWYTPIPANAPLHPNSAGFKADFQRQIQTYYGNVTINTTSYASPVYTATASTPTTKVQVWDCQNKGYADANLTSQFAAVPIPAGASPSSGTDGEMTIYQPSTDTVWEFWQTRTTSGGWQACWGGRMQGASKVQGIWTNPYGTTATGLPFLGGQITAEELQRGEIRHAIGIALVDLEKSGIFSWPANRSDGYNPNGAANRIPEGLRFRLDPTVNVDALNIHKVAKIIAKAAQKYGFVVWDKAGAISVRVQNPKSYTAMGQPDPYAALFGGTANYAILNGFPWDKLQFMPMNYGKP